MTTTKHNELNPMERYVIESKGTEPPFSGEYDDFYESGTYICRRCNAGALPLRGQVQRALRVARLRTTRCPAPCGSCPTRTAPASRSSA